MTYGADRFEISEPQNVSRYSIERLLRALVSLGAEGRSFLPENLAEDFGSQSTQTAANIKAIYEIITQTDSQKARTFFDQWRLLFSEVCGYDVNEPSQGIVALAGNYGIVGNVSSAELVFSIHTYYAIFMKFLAAEIVSSFNLLPIGVVRRSSNKSTSNALKREVEILEQGGIWSEIGISNFLEGDIFSWYLDAWDNSMANVVWDIVRRLKTYDPTTLSVDPAETQDLLKQLYQNLIPASIRHSLGEYYTPDWLAEHVLDRIGYDGNPDLRLLDPACGSGTFIVTAINRVRNWYARHRHEAGLNEEHLLEKILNNIIGFDLNPLAVMAARTNYLLAIRDLLSFASAVELPVYLCDSIITPSGHHIDERGQHSLFIPQEDRTLLPLGQAIELRTTVGSFLVPPEIAESRDVMARYTSEMEGAVRNESTVEDFLARCEEESIPICATKLHEELYTKILTLAMANQNGVWARIIKNAFAPRFLERVDFIVGNPPWINWKSLPDIYRRLTIPLWQQYDLFRHVGYRARLGGAHDDISILMTYVAHDHYLKPGGKLGFVITQTVFKTKGGGDGFRSLKYKTSQGFMYLKPLAIDDMSSFRVFEEAANRTAAVVLEKTESSFTFPIKYTIWKKRRGAQVSQRSALAHVKNNTRTQTVLAEPIDEGEPTSPWITAPRAVLTALKKTRGRSQYVARKGVYCATNAVYWLTQKTDLKRKHVLITNLAATQRRQVEQVTRAIEADFVYHLVRGRDASRWRYTSNLYVVLPQDKQQPSSAVPEKVLRRKFPKTFHYFKQFENVIRSCKLLRTFFDPEKDPFYSSYNVGAYTFQPYKVIWKEICQEIEAAVLDCSESVFIPDHKLVIVSFDDPGPAYYLCSFLNSSPIRVLVRSYTVSTSISGHVFDFAWIPVYDSENKVHRALSRLGRQCHSCKARNDLGNLARLEAAIDCLVARIWKLTKSEIGLLQRYYDELGVMRLSPSRKSTFPVACKI